ncbi:hypothetical protein NI17_009405 [Thermobifida halotolerans]|uniref:DUF8175 domain-containing protein n=1 Tax=Thermobifida halotolerans TaxID=483545 RepID=A0AA97M0C7_9ACTN|nr:hypothetical protein [Thermobifida halotolerans]UOE21316.1 hypothetical protein NI17_009405 [Thermobifida halotolerans]
MAHDERKRNQPFVSKTYLASAGIVGLIAILGIAVVGTTLWPDGDETAPPVAASPTADPSPESTTAPAEGESVCGLPASDQTQIDEPPADTEWEFVGTMQAPSVPDAGPGMVADNGFRQCYAHSPEGALVAAANVLAMGTDPNLVRELNEELVAEGPGRDAVLADMEANPPTSDTGIRLSIAGYRLLGYGPNHARIDLAVEGSNGSIASVTTDLKWEEGDWKVELRPDGQPVIPVAQLADTVGYHPWSAGG